MAYKIDYIPVGKRQYLNKRKTPGWLFPTLAVLAFPAAFLLLTVHHKSTDWLLPGDPAVTKAALIELIENLRAGEQFGDAITAFCREVIRSGT